MFGKGFCLLLLLEELRTGYSNKGVLELQNNVNTATQNNWLGVEIKNAPCCRAQKVEPPPSARKHSLLHMQRMSISLKEAPNL